MKNTCGSHWRNFFNGIVKMCRCWHGPEAWLTTWPASVNAGPDVVLLDIKMDDGTGFDLLKQAEPIDLKVIFITAYDQYAVEAFTEITRQRIKAINRRSKNKITMAMTDLMDENGAASGTSVRFQFPV